jgi:uncharacterized protein
VPHTCFIMRLWDATTGFLKASHRELDERTTPYHPHTRAVPVEPGKIDSPGRPDPTAVSGA